MTNDERMRSKTWLRLLPHSVKKSPLSIRTQKGGQGAVGGGLGEAAGEAGREARNAETLNAEER